MSGDGKNREQFYGGNVLPNLPPGEVTDYCS
jgi:hypothetical protein